MMLPELFGEELAAALDAAVADLLEMAGVAGPPVDARAVAAALRLVVAWDERLSGRARYVRVNPRRRGEPQGSILLRPEPRPERLHWAIAHEIGEDAAGRIFSQLGIEPLEAPAAMREMVANQLAGRLLLPSDWLAADALECDWDLFALKARYETASHELIGRRMLDFSPAVIVTVWDQGRLTWRRSNLPGRLPPLSSGERACWSEAHHTGQSAQRRERGYVVRVWPIHEPGWPREIMRTQPQDSDLADGEAVDDDAFVDRGDLSL
jgi:hypothetical protein